MYKELLDLTVSQLSGGIIYYDESGIKIESDKKYDIFPNDIVDLLKESIPSVTEDIDFVIENYYGYKVYIYKKDLEDSSYVVISLFNSFELTTLNKLLPIGLIKLDKNLNVIYSNEYSQQMLGLSFDEVLDRNWIEILSSSCYDELINVFEQKSFSENNLKEIIHIVSPLGRKSTLSLQVITNHQNTESIRNYISFYILILDITQEHNANEAIKYLATHDKLTELSTRDILVQEIQTQYQKGNITNCGLLFLDLDGFKQINDTLGHNIGDEVLKIVAKKINNHIKHTDVAARFGGDEFVIFFTNMPSHKAFDIANNLSGIINQTLNINGKKVSISSSIGFSLGRDILEYVKDEIEINIITEKWLKMVDIAMYESKKSKQSKITFFNENIHKDYLNTIRKELYIQNILEKREVEIYFQPIYKNEKIYSIEALARFEEYSITEMLEISLYTSRTLDFVHLLFEKGLENYSYFLNKTSREDILLNINITVEMLSNIDFVEYCISQCKKFSLNPNNIYLEITEEAIETEETAFAENIHKLASYGFKFSLDDFGTGYSSIKRLINYNFTQIKLDISLIKDIEKNIKQQKALKVSVELGKALDLEVLLEGIENEIENNFAKNIDIPFTQGFYMKKPQNLDNIIKYVQEK